MAIEECVDQLRYLVCHKLRMRRKRRRGTACPSNQQDQSPQE
jgi:hypothetical protein